MSGAARLGDHVQGITSGEHSGHTPPHTPMQFTGEISAGCASDVLINGLPAATVGSTTAEHDACCGTSHGAIAAGSATVFINGKPAARLGDALSAHSGTGAITGGSGNVLIGG